MCEPITLALAGVALAGEVAGAVGEHKAQSKAAKANRKAANDSYALETEDLKARELQEILAASREKDLGARQGQAAHATTAVAAAESGVAGKSIDLLLQDVERQQAEHAESVNINLGMTKGQLDREQRAAGLRRDGRIAQVQDPNPWMTGLKIGTAVAGTAADMYAARPKAGV